MVDPGRSPERIAPLETGRRWHRFSGALSVSGLVAFAVSLATGEAQRAWQAYLVNWVFWTGLCCGAVVFVAVLNMTNARWGRPVKRLAEALGAFLPLAFVLFWVLYLGREALFSWIHEPVHGKEMWLEAGFLFARDGFGLLVLTGLSLSLVHFSVRSDLALAAGDQARVSKGWRAQVVLSPILGIVYALVMSLLAFDLIMSLDPHWLSTLFGAYYFVGSFYTGLAGLVVLSWVVLGRADGPGVAGPKLFHDLGKLLFAFCLATGDFFYSQFLVIWYGNLPEETRYVILRIRGTPWEPLAWTVLGCAFAVPFVVLLSRKIKMKRGPMVVLAGVVLAGMWLERFLLVVPSTWRGEGIPLGLLEVAVTAGFLGLVGLSVLGFLERFPLMPISDPFFREFTMEAAGDGGKVIGARGRAGEDG